MGCLAHGLGPTRENSLRLAEDDLLRGLRNGLEARATKTIDRDRRCLDGYAGTEADVASEVNGVGRGLQHVSEDNVINVVGLDSTALERSPRGEDAQLGCGKVLEGPPESSESGPHTREKHDILIRNHRLTGWQVNMYLRNIVG
jgi:hypothetical protein